MLKVAVVQTNSNEDVQANLDVVSKLIEQAAQSQVKLVLLPENFGFLGVEENKLRVAEEAGSGLMQDTVASLAKKYGLHIVAGTIPIKSPSKSKVYASSMIYDDTGEMVCRYDKIHLFDVTVSEKEKYVESNATLAGSSPKLYQAPFGKIGLSVCYDVRFPELYRTYSNAGVDIICVPAAFTYNTGKVHWDILTRARAIENQAFVLAANQEGSHPQDRKTYGHSMIIDPWGEVIAMQKQQVGVIIADLDLDEMHKIRARFPALEHKKLFEKQV